MIFESWMNDREQHSLCVESSMNSDRAAEIVSPAPLANANARDHGALWLLLLIVMLGASVRLQCLGELSLWFDESFDWKMAAFPLSEQWPRVAQDNHPPLYFYLLKLWTMMWGNSPATIRFLSVLFGLFTITGAFAVVREVEALVFGCGAHDRRANIPALFAATLVALSPFQIEWSQTARMYALGAALAVWSTWALVRALYAPSPRWTDWLPYVPLATGLIYTHYFGFFILAAHGVYCATRTGRSLFKYDGRGPSGWRGMIYPLCAFMAVAALWLPWVSDFLSQRRRGVEQEWGRPAGVDHLVRSIADMFGFMWSTPPTDLTTAWIVTGLFAVISLGAAVFGRRPERLLGMNIVFSFGFALAFSTGPRTIIDSRYFLFAHAFFLCGAAVLIFRVPRHVPRALISFLILLAAVWQCYQQLLWRESRATLPSFQGAIAYIESIREPEDPIFVNGPRDLVASSPYVEHPGTLFVLSSRRDFRFGEGTSVLVPQEYARFEAVAAMHTKHAWVVFTTGGSPVEMPQEWVDVSEERFNDWRYGQVIVRQYERRDALRDVLRSRAATRPPATHAPKADF